MVKFFCLTSSAPLTDERLFLMEADVFDAVVHLEQSAEVLFDQLSVDLLLRQSRQREVPEVHRGQVLDRHGGEDFALRYKCVP